MTIMTVVGDSDDMHLHDCGHAALWKLAICDDDEDRDDDCGHDGGNT